MTNKTLRHVYGFAIALTISPLAAHSADFPSRTITVVAATTPGGILDVAARILAPALERQMKQPVVVENRGGAGAQVAGAAVAKAPRDGHTLLVSTSLALVPVFMKTPLVTVKDLAPISLIAESPLLFTANSDLPVNSMAELFALVKANPGKFNHATVGAGAPLSLYFEFWKAKEGLNMQAIAYPGPGPIVAAMLRGDVAMAFLSIAAGKAALDSGKIKVLALSGRSRMRQFPNTPTFDEVGYPWVGGTMIAMHSAAGTPSDLIARLHAMVLAAGKEPEVVKRMEDLNFVITLSTPEQLRQREEADAKWGLDVARAANLRPQ